MKTIRKTALALGLFLGLSGLSFGDTLYSWSLGYYRLGDQFPSEDFGRSQNGITFNFVFYYFPDNPLPLGFFAKTSFGAFTSGYEWKGDDQLQSLDDYRGSNADVRVSLAPSYRLRLGEKVQIPISFGPAFGIYWEKSDPPTYYVSGSTNEESFYYESLNFGIMADVALLIIPRTRFFLKQGLSVEWDFLHLERGEMKMTYRETRNTRFKGKQYFALGFSVYFGVGLLFE